MERLTDAQRSDRAPPTEAEARPRAAALTPTTAPAEGILWILRTGARWKDLPREYPGPAACWRRLAEWERKEVWLDLWRAFIAQLGHHDWSEAFMDGTFAPAKERGIASERHAKARAQSAR